MFASADKTFAHPPRPLIMERKWKSNVELAPNCPRCASSNTKFCYYNNYSLSQPRFFCKGCRRYWTKGGSLRNVPVGGVYRKNRRGRSVPNERVSMANYHVPPSSDNPLDDHRKSCPASNGNSVNNGTSADIDLAVVFAKFLTQNSCEPELVTAPELSYEVEASFFDVSSNYSNPSSNDSPPIHENLQDQTNMFECQKQFEIESTLETQVMSPEPNTHYELQPLLRDEVLQDVLWPWLQPPQYLQEFESELSHDHLPIHPNLITDNWSSFESSFGAL